jgi:hypothetical protein
MLRSLTLAVAFLMLPATAAEVAASYCGQVSELSTARLRWAAMRQSRVEPADGGKICRAYGIQFYEAVEARQAASLCEDGVNRQRNLEQLDAEIDAFNHPIAAQCIGS